MTLLAGLLSLYVIVTLTAIHVSQKTTPKPPRK
jgi:hypothetical protein